MTIVPDRASRGVASNAGKGFLSLDRSQLFIRILHEWHNLFRQIPYPSLWY